MSNFFKKILNFYNTNTYFHSFILALEAAVISFVASYHGGVPASKAAWLSLLFAFAGALWGAIKRWLASNVATKSVPLDNLQLTAARIAPGIRSIKTIEVTK
jgi:hypothetical protein